MIFFVSFQPEYLVLLLPFICSQQNLKQAKNLSSVALCIYCLSGEFMRSFLWKEMGEKMMSPKSASDDSQFPSNQWDSGGLMFLFSTIEDLICDNFWKHQFLLDIGNTYILVNL